MKKSIFIFTALFAATFANAQITLLHIFESNVSVTVNPYASIYGYDLEAPCFYDMNLANGIVQLYNKEDFSIYKAIQTPHIGQYFACYLVSRNILTTDNKVCVAIAEESGSSNKTTYVYNEDGQLLATLVGGVPTLVKVNGHYYILTYNNEGSTTQTRVYSVPGNGDAQNVETPSAPRKSARKVLSQDQVLIESSDHIFDAQGKMVK